MSFNASLRNTSNVVRIKHTAGVKQRLYDAHKVMGLANKMSQNLEGIFNQWAKVRINDQEVKKLIQLAYAPTRKPWILSVKVRKTNFLRYLKIQFEDAFAYAMVSDTQLMETTKGTLYGAYKAVTGYYQNVHKNKDGEAKLQSIVLGGTTQLKTQKAFELCTSFASDGSEVLNLN